jgi:hypothetical protein
MDTGASIARNDDDEKGDKFWRMKSMQNDKPNLREMEVRTSRASHKPTTQQKKHGGANGE